MSRTNEAEGEFQQVWGGWGVPLLFTVSLGVFCRLFPKVAMGSCHGDGARSQQRAWRAWVLRQSLTAAPQSRVTAGTGPSVSACSRLLLGPEGRVPRRCPSLLGGWGCWSLKAGDGCHHGAGEGR